MVGHLVVFLNLKGTPLLGRLAQQVPMASHLLINPNLRKYPTGGLRVSHDDRGPIKIFVELSAGPHHPERRGTAQERARPRAHELEAGGRSPSLSRLRAQGSPPGGTSPEGPRSEGPAGIVPPSLPLPLFPYFLFDAGGQTGAAAQNVVLSVCPHLLLIVIVWCWF